MTQKFHSWIYIQEKLTYIFTQKHTQILRATSFIIAKEGNRNVQTGKRQTSCLYKEGRKGQNHTGPHELLKLRTPLQGKALHQEETSGNRIQNGGTGTLERK